MTRGELSASTPKPAQALERMLSALRILDELEAPGDIGSHLDLAIARLRQRFALPAEADSLAHTASTR